VAGLPNLGIRLGSRCRKDAITMKKYAALFVAAVVFASTWVLGTPEVSTADTLTVSGDVAGFSTGGGFLWESQADQQRDLDMMAATGAKWLRLDFPWPSVEPADNQWNWGPFDRIVSMARARGFNILGLPSYTPDWAKSSTGGGPADPATFASFLSALVTRYAPQGVKHWEIWNEPNMAWSWNPVDPAAYTRLLKAAYPAVKQADPTATVLSAGLAPGTDQSDGSLMSPLTFAKAIYTNGGKGSFDAMALHPYGYPALPTDATSKSWNTMFRAVDIHQVMTDNGDGAKQIWFTEFGAPTGTGSSAVTEARQPDFVREGFVARQQWSWAGPLFWYAHRDAGTNLADREQNFGLVHADFTPKPALATFDSIVEPAAAATSTTSTTTTVPPTTTTTVPPTTTTTVPPTTTTTVPPTTTTTVPPTTWSPPRTTTTTTRHIIINWGTATSTTVPTTRSTTTKSTTTRTTTKSSTIVFRFRIMF
jgi:hypothetical protein